MATIVIRTDEEIIDLRNKAQEISFRTEDEGDRDDAAEAVYQALKWVTGDAEKSDVLALLSE